jgi:hypothetical protein
LQLGGRRPPAGIALDVSEGSGEKIENRLHHRGIIRTEPVDRQSGLCHGALHRLCTHPRLRWNCFRPAKIKAQYPGKARSAVVCQRRPPRYWRHPGLTPPHKGEGLGRGSRRSWGRMSVSGSHRPTHKRVQATAFSTFFQRLVIFPVPAFPRSLIFPPPLPHADDGSPPEQLGGKWLRSGAERGPAPESACMGEISRLNLDRPISGQTAGPKDRRRP